MQATHHNVIYLTDSTNENGFWPNIVKANRPKKGLVDCYPKKNDHSVIGQLKQKLAPSHKRSSHTYTVHTFGRDAFTSKDMLEGARANKFRPQHTCPLHQNKKHHPLNELSLLNRKKTLGKNDVVIVSFGGNDIRELLSRAAHTGNRPSLNDLLTTLQTLCENYAEVLNKIREISPNIQIVVQSQYPVDKDYSVYNFFKQQFKTNQPIDVFYGFMKVWLDTILEHAHKKNVRHVIDLTSSLDHTNKALYINQIELSQSGGKIAAELQFAVIQALFEGAGDELSSPDSMHFHWMKNQKNLQKTIMPPQSLDDSLIDITEVKEPTKLPNDSVGIKWKPWNLKDHDNILSYAQAIAKPLTIPQTSKVLKASEVLKDPEKAATWKKWVAGFLVLLAIALIVSSFLVPQISLLLAMTEILESGFSSLSLVHGVGLGMAALGIVILIVLLGIWWFAS